MKNLPISDDILRLEPADIVLVHGHGIIQSLIRFFSRSWGEKKTVINHVGMITEGGPIWLAKIAEARWRYLVHRLFPAYVDSNQAVAIYRPKNIPLATRSRIATRAASFEGTRYGWTKIVLHALDKLLNGAYFFRRLTCLPNRPICSYAVAVAYADYGFSFGVKSYRAQPDDIWDYVVNSDNYICVRPLEEIKTCQA